MNVSRLFKSELTVLLSLVAVAVFVRFPTFFPSVINHDESTYIVIGRQIFAGSVYLVDYIDTKPIGIFLIYGLIDLLSNDDVFMFRLVAAVFVGATAFIIFKISRLFQGVKVSIIAGLLYVISTSVFVFYGVSPNTELYFIPFTLLAFYLLLKHREAAAYSTHHLLLIGLLLGISFTIKFVVVAEVALVGAYFLLRFFRGRKSLLECFRNIAFSAIGFLVPLGLIAGYYGSIGEIDSLLFYTFEVSGQYAQSMTLFERIKYFADFSLRNFFLVIPFVLSLKKVSDSANDIKWFFAVHLILVVLVIAYLGKPLGHYQLQLIAPLIICAIIYLGQTKWMQNIDGKRLSVSVIVSALLLFSGQYFTYQNKTDEPLTVVKYLKAAHPNATSLYTGDYHHILYHYLDLAPPNRYVHRTLLFDPNHRETLEIDVAEEGQRILDKSPDIILLRRNHANTPLTQLIKVAYAPVDTLLDGRLLVYSRVP